jgi:hypothetical protein
MPPLQEDSFLSQEAVGPVLQLQALRSQVQRERPMSSFDHTFVVAVVLLVLSVIFNNPSALESGDPLSLESPLWR